MIESLKGSLQALENKVENFSGPKSDKTFAGIVKETIHEVRNEDKIDKVKINSKEKIIRNENVLIIRPKSDANNTNVKNSVEEVKKSLKKCSVQITSCRESSKGAIVVKFPCAESKAKAESEISAEINASPTLKMSDPVKILPKMYPNFAKNVPKALDENSITETIMNKNTVVNSQ